MMKSVQEIYEVLGQVAIESAPKDDKWQLIILRFEHEEDMVGDSGLYVDLEGVRKPLSVELSWDDSELIHDLHTTTTEGGNNRWNLMHYIARPDGSFDVEFIWDEDKAEIMACIAATQHIPEPRRGNELDFIKEEQLKRKTNRIYDGIAHVLLQNAPTHAWEILLLSLTRPPLCYEAQAQTAPGRRTALLLLGEAAAVQALEELTREGNHLGWESATLAVEPTGQYRYSFVWAGAGEFNLPSRYQRAGQVHPGSTESAGTSD